ncbi:MAG: S8 family serine peptidase [Chitinophagaceae bacterium]
MKRKIVCLIASSFIFCTLIFAQQNPKQWYLLDPKKDSTYGISLNETYQFLKGKKYTPIIVAVIDSGVDTTQQDLKNVLWHNAKEIPNNGKDEDGNGYVDDVYGWNFLGNKNGADLESTTDEKTRVYYRFKNKYDGKIINEDSLNADEKAEYEEWKKAADQMTITKEDQMEVMMLEMVSKNLAKIDSVLRNEMNKNEYSIEELEQFVPSSEGGKKAKLNYLRYMKLFEVTDDVTNTSILSDLKEETEGRQKSLNAKINPPPDYRAQIINDDYFNINDKYYGNADIMGLGPLHGTHVCGIIAAQRDNNIGINGIADHVKIMMIRAIPDGDEYDKDVALAIKYAVDNGAKVINMSFGKSFSPEKKWVDEAVQYAEKKDVLIVHAAGNEMHNIDSVDNFPNTDLKTFHTTATNFITVGASGDTHIADGNLIATFSNYGKNSVNIFAPGVKIYSTLPYDSAYGYESGTSMASPVVTGIAALIREYYPQLSAQQVKYVIEKSAVHLSDSVKVNKPGTNDKVSMSELCTSGGFVNASAALQLASTLKPDKKNIPILPKATLQTTKPN